VAGVIGIAAFLLGLPLVFTIAVANFVGGYIPYVGAFLGGGLAVIVALGDGGLDVAAVMLVLVLAANLMLENFVEPKVMGRAPSTSIRSSYTSSLPSAASSAGSSASSWRCPSPRSARTASRGSVPGAPWRRSQTRRSPP
jgi:hypothetical protein